jgi:hypothetical protein
MSNTKPLSSWDKGSNPVDEATSRVKAASNLGRSARRSSQQPTAGKRVLQSPLDLRLDEETSLIAVWYQLCCNGKDMEVRWFDDGNARS